MTADSSRLLNGQLHGMESGAWERLVVRNSRPDHLSLLIAQLELTNDVVIIEPHGMGTKGWRIILPRNDQTYALQHLLDQEPDHRTCDPQRRECSVAPYCAMRSWMERMHAGCTTGMSVLPELLLPVLIGVLALRLVHTVHAACRGPAAPPASAASLVDGRSRTGRHPNTSSAWPGPQAGRLA
jgi:hypothetical protein